MLAALSVLSSFHYIPYDFTSTPLSTMSTTANLLEEAKGFATSEPKRAEKIYSDILSECGLQRRKRMS